MSMLSLCVYYNLYAVFHFIFSSTPLARINAINVIFSVIDKTIKKD